MTAPAVRSRCCRRLAHRAACNGAPAHHGQQQQQQRRHASSHSLDSPSPAPPSRRPRPPPRPPPRARRSNDPLPPPASDASFRDYVASAAAARPARLGRYSRQPVHAPDRPLQAQQLPGKAPHAYVSELEERLAQGDAAEAWAFFQREFQSPESPALARLAFIDVAKHSSRAVYRKMLALLVDRWLEQIHRASAGASPSLPAPVEVLRRFDHLGISDRAMCHATVWSLATTLEFAAPAQFDLAQPAAIPTLLQLLDLLPLCLYPQSAQAVPRDSDVNLARLFTHKGDNLSDGAASALLVHDLLRDCSPLPAELAHHASLVAAIRRVVGKKALSASVLNAMDLKLKKAKLPPDAVANILDRLSRRPTTPALRDTDQVKKRPTRLPSLPSTLAEFVKFIHAAVERQNLDTLERLWANAMQTRLDEHFKVPSNSPSLQRTYEAFLVAFFELRRPREGLQVWNAMLQSGFEPTVRTWNVMMKACHISRDLDIMESLWQRMRQSGLQPDAVSWGTRIYGLFRIGTVQDGMRALDQVGREWLAAQQQIQKQPRAAANELAEVVKPNTAILNSAISALRGGKSQHIPTVLAWGRSFNIEPDIITYNALLHTALSHGEAGEATKILQRMAATNVKPDSATFTVLVNSMFYSSLLKDLSPSEQAQKVMGLVESFEKYGLHIDQQGYALLIDRMSKQYNNAEAAQQIIEHMHSRNVKPTPHIYTILMTSYFESDPPNLAAADALWSDIQKRTEKSGPGLDVIFYDRMMEGYARHGDVGRTKTFLNRMSKEGKRPGWLALASVVRCLAQNTDWDMLHQVVFDCHRQEGLFSVGLRGQKGQKEFWDLVGDIALDLYHTQVGKDMLAIVDSQKQAMASDRPQVVA